jgi:ADP-ribose pyrophosphatase
MAAASGETASPVAEKVMDHKRLATARVYSGKLLKIDLDRVRLPNGRETDLEMVRHPGASAVLPFVTNDEVLLIRQFRYAAGGFILEVPAGTLHSGEKPEACARREVEEETGHRPGRLERLASIYTTPGFTDEIIHLYTAYDLKPTAQHLDHDEVISVERITFESALAAIGRGEIVDSKTICALLLAKESLRR